MEHKNSETSFIMIASCIVILYLVYLHDAFWSSNTREKKMKKNLILYGSFNENKYTRGNDWKCTHSFYKHTCMYVGILGNIFDIVNK